MQNKREEKRKKREKRVIYDGISVGEKTLNAFIVFGIVAVSLAIVCGYFMGNYGSLRPSDGDAIPADADFVCVV